MESKRCKKCFKKVGLLGHQCSCSFIFCSKCRYAEEHNCTINYMEKERKQLEKNNPLIQAEKLERL